MEPSPRHTCYLPCGERCKQTWIFVKIYILKSLIEKRRGYFCLYKLIYLNSVGLQILFLKKWVNSKVSYQTDPLSACPKGFLAIVDP